MLEQIQLNQGWEFTQTTKLGNGMAADKYYPVTQFPTVIQLDLLNHGMIPDPYIGQNEPEILWVGEADWSYRTQTVPVTTPTANQRVDVVFEGLDTAVQAYLNNQLILDAKDMFLKYRVDVTGVMRAAAAEGLNEITLELKFASNILTSRKELARLGSRGHEDDLHFGGAERLFLRKAQYHWGWDWGPAVNTCGPYKEIYLEKYSHRVDDLQVIPEVDESLKSALIIVRGVVASAGSAASSGLVAEFRLLDPEGNLLSTWKTDASDGQVLAKIDLKNPDLWYPHQYGKQPLYTLEVSLADNLGQYFETAKTFGVRRLRLNQKPLKLDNDNEGLSFTFEVNNQEVFCGGANWIPGDVLLPRFTKEKYRKWVETAKAGNQTMIRCWGGGIVEEEAFFETCDREGIIVWQDFLFACGNYPDNPDYVELVREEVRQQVIRLGNHPSVVLFCGNNEDYLLADRWGWDWDKNDNEGPWSDTNFPARVIYEKVMPAVVKQYAPHVPYWRSSPYGGYMANDKTIGDTHIWDVWHGEMAPYQDYIKFMSRFPSEFGFGSPPNVRTIRSAIPDESEQYSQSETFDAHDKGPGNTRRYGMYMAENYRFRMEPFDDYIYCVQLLQAEAMSYALTHFRREFLGPGRRRCSGGLIWQLNDIWPGTSWALVDVAHTPKLAFYAVKHALESTTISISRNVTKTPSYLARSYNPEKASAIVWVSTTATESQSFNLSLKAFDIASGNEVDLEIPDRVVTINPNGTTILETDLSIPDCKKTVIVGYLKNLVDGMQVSRFVNWPEPFKFVKFARQATIDLIVEDNQVVISADVPLKGVTLGVPEAEGEDASWSDNYIDLVPKEPVTIGVSGLMKRNVELKWMCHWEIDAKVCRR
ncbi:hypothetical protein TRVA0_038S01200 [Trichomonascus vanleenenianus]|uniref:uncharacterized protein n=1 Tax=Trichomonascus vanleenenianus TaxID=2268995 RepID=UPI003EC98100